MEYSYFAKISLKFVINKEESLNKYTPKDLSELFNIGKETLRYYENINLIPNPAMN